MARGVILERKVSANVASRQAIAERLVGLQTDIGTVTFEVYDSAVILGGSEGVGRQVMWRDRE